MIGAAVHLFAASPVVVVDVGALVPFIVLHIALVVGVVVVVVLRKRHAGQKERAQCVDRCKSPNSIHGLPPGSEMRIGPRDGGKHRHLIGKFKQPAGESDPWFCGAFATLEVHVDAGQTFESLKAVRGTRDLLPPETELWNRVEAVARDVFSRYGFGEIRTPSSRTPALRARGWRRDRHCQQGDVHVGGPRPGAEGKRAVADAAAGEHGRGGAGVHRARDGRARRLQKLYYIGPQFRRERPQRGRYRQF